MTTEKAEAPPESQSKVSEIWDFLGKTDPNYTKPITGKRFGGTSINATYCYRKMTEQFGPCGIGWKFEVTKRTLHDAPDGQLLLFVDVALYIRGEKNPGNWSDPIPGVGGNLIIAKESKGLHTDDEAYKKATTDALTNAMKYLGMSADIHTGLWDDNKYQTEVRQEFGTGKHQDDKKPEPKPEEKKPPLNKLFNTAEEINEYPKATPERQAEIVKLGSGRRATWLKEADRDIKVLASPEAVARYKEGNKEKIAALGNKQKEWFDTTIAARLQAVSQAPLTEVDQLEDEIPF